MSRGYEAFFGLAERPFSLTPDPTYVFESLGHQRALSTLTCGLRRRERFILLTGELGVGKTTLCRTFVPELRALGPVGVDRQSAAHTQRPVPVVTRRLRGTRPVRLFAPTSTRRPTDFAIVWCRFSTSLDQRARSSSSTKRTRCRSASSSSCCSWGRSSSSASSPCNCS